MKNDQKCPKCGSTDIATGIELNAGGANTVQLEVCRKQFGGLVQPVEGRSKATSYVCCQCGFVEIYADAPTQFRSANR
jgi:predicted nucleic-acid-binding Zn-ribbon protein